MLRLGVQAGTSSPSPVGHSSPHFPLEKLLSGPLLSIALNPLGTQLLPHAPQGLCLCCWRWDAGAPPSIGMCTGVSDYPRIPSKTSKPDDDFFPFSL